MPRYARMLNSDQETVYHAMSRTALDGFPIRDAEKDEFVGLLKHFGSIYFTEVLGYTVMGNHFHLAVKMLAEEHFSDEEIRERYARCHGEEKYFDEKEIPGCREKWANLSMFMKDLKQSFSRYYNKRHERSGAFWGGRFKSLIVEEGETLVNLLAYIDLNCVRAGLAERPEDYRWCSLGYHVQTDNKDAFLSLDFGLKEFGNIDDGECFRLYRKFVYETGAVASSKGAAIDHDILEDEQKQDFNITRAKRFKYRTRYFTDSGIIGTKDFVRTHYIKFKDYLQSKRDKQPQSIKGLPGIYSLKRLSET